MCTVLYLLVFVTCHPIFLMCSVFQPSIAARPFKRMFLYFFLPEIVTLCSIYREGSLLTN